MLLLALLESSFLDNRLGTSSFLDNRWGSSCFNNRQLIFDSRWGTSCFGSRLGASLNVDNKIAILPPGEFLSSFFVCPSSLSNH